MTIHGRRVTPRRWRVSSGRSYLSPSRRKPRNDFERDRDKCHEETLIKKIGDLCLEMISSNNYP